EKLLDGHGGIKTKRIKHHTIFFELSYARGEHNIKVEINLREFGSRYELLNYFGIGMKVMIKEDMFAHNIVAMYERLGKTNRDIYDVWFFSKEQWPINRDILKTRTKMPLKDFLHACIEKLEKLPGRSILAGMGELLDEKQKVWVKAKLRSDTIFQLKLLLDNEK
ncbi:MAG: nucleotidyl transferase AbiEii/AbiGii toxin family protein, partial [Candidatus Zixiibacteriota bacterium]